MPFFAGPRGHKSKADKAGPKKESFQLLYVAVLREYFDKEFSAAFKVGDRDLFFLLTFLMENDALCQDWLGIYKQTQGKLNLHNNESVSFRIRTPGFRSRRHERPRCGGEDSGEQNGLFEPFMSKNGIMLPRQARDKHGSKLKTRYDCL